MVVVVYRGDKFNTGYEGSVLNGLRELLCYCRVGPNMIEHVQRALGNRLVCVCVCVN